MKKDFSADCPLSSMAYIKIASEDGRYTPAVYYTELKKVKAWIDQAIKNCEKTFTKEALKL